tara:strand:- start:6751 stop:7179 length:429 start_codon:yes stop_codon:yes gene_type:complete
MLSNKIWGPHYWFVIFTIGLTYPIKPNDISKKKYYEFIQNLPIFMPNPEITDVFSKLLDKYPVTPYLDSRDMFLRWIHFIHNRVNVTLGKPEISFEDALVKYYDNYKIEKQVENNFVKYKKIYIYIFTILILLFLSYCFYYN